MTEHRPNRPNIVRRAELKPGVSQPLVTPIQPSVVYSSPSIATLHAQYSGEAEGFVYAREGHPNAELLARKIDALEGGEGGLILGSGMAAISAAILGLLSKGDHVLAGSQLYGRSLRLLKQDLPRFGMEASFADPSNPAEFEAAIKPNTKLILVEVIANPTIRIADMHAITKMAQARGIILMVDNTFTTPRCYQPFAAGADIVMHSVTKLLAGHSDVTLGYVSAKNPDHAKAIYDFATTTGMTPAPQECWLAERGLLTFDLRFDRATENAARLADWLAEQPQVARVLYPGRTDHPDHELALRVLGSEFGNMVSFELHEQTEAAADRLVQAMPDLPFAPTLGDVSTTHSHPRSSSHRGLTAEESAALGISDGFFRISVGIEDFDLLASNFAKGLAAI